ncbi:MAG TPA: NAD(P)-dependent oxidoreductase [Pyrinomonadaceae bacterium]|jgi:nucleoside-diphosphate-sugar epimerase|nr:NAD(P)-dependent oxidoreductase [Pyrinomonadaceae bacterium]
MRVLLTGGTGLIGAQVLERLIARGDLVRVLVRPQTLAQPHKVRHLKGREQVEIVQGSLTDKNILDQATGEVDVIYHTAALLPRPGTQPADLIQTNVEGTKNLLRASVASGRPRVVFTSSVIVYDSGPWPVTEDAPVKNRGVYGKNKIDAENLLFHHREDDGLDYVVLRLSHVYGPGATYFDRLLNQILSSPYRVLLEKRRKVEQWVHLTDVAEAIILAGTQPAVAGQTFNIAGNQIITYRELVPIVMPAASRRHWSGFESTQRHAGPASTLKYDIRKAQSLLGFTPKMPWQEGIKQMLEMLDKSDGLGPQLAPARRWSRRLGR